MGVPRWPGWNIMLPTLAWVVLLALLPWWLGLPLLLALVAAVLLLQHRLAGEHAALIRRGLRWGLPGVLFALQRALGGDAFAWGAVLLGALAGYTLLAGLEAWLDRAQRRDPATAASAEWPELALAPIGPAAEIIELQLPAWQSADDGLIDPLADRVEYRGGNFLFADGSGIDGVGPHAAFSPAGRWFVARMPNDRGIVLWDRERQRRHRLRGWQLCGWYREQPWLIRREGDMPLALPAVLGQDDED
jgi:prepilin-type processing-associated H-X9-DG protein